MTGNRQATTSDNMLIIRRVLECSGFKPSYYLDFFPESFVAGNFLPANNVGFL